MTQLFLRVFDPNDPGDKPAPSWPLSRLIRDDFVPNVLEPDRPAEATLADYWTLSAKWKQAVFDPPASECCASRRGQTLIDQFRAWLAGANHRRGLGEFRTISAERQRLYLDRLAAVFRRMLELKLIAESPRFPHVHVPFKETKLPYLMSDARAIYAACASMLEYPRQRKRRKNPPRGWLPAYPLLWRAIVSGWYWIGARSDDVLELVWGDVKPDDGQRPIRVVAEAKKTGKPIVMPLHPDCVADFEAIRPATCDPGAMIFPRAYDRRMLAKEYDRLQTLAGIPEGRQLTPQAWRRTHGREVGRTGQYLAVEIARISLGHSSAATTINHYLGPLAESVAKMARLVEEHP